MANLSRKKRERMLNFLSTIKEGHTDNDKVLQAIHEIENELSLRKYGLIWEEHEEDIDVQMRTHIPVFTEIKENEVIGDADNNKTNFLLEGDNLHSLKLLEKTHKGEIDLIYIDPPYNTGGTDFKYNDDYVEKEDIYRHSKWLSFMSERLKVARKLLSTEGAIFIQINDIELAQLKILCDEILGEENFLNVISVNMKNVAGASGGGEDKKFKKNCEYILVYAKEYSTLPLFNGSYVYTEISDLVQQYLDEGKSWKYTTVLVDSGEKEYYGSTVDGDGNEIKVYTRKNVQTLSIRQIAERDGITQKEAYHKYGIDVFRTTNAQSSIRTRVMDYRKEQAIEEDVISIEYIPKTGRNKGKVYEQLYKGDVCNLFVWLRDTSEVIDGALYKKDLQGTYWDATPGTKNLTKEGNVEFSNGKKPVDLIKEIVGLYPSKDITVLDFFAGSGTTGHAVLSLNEEDSGTRRFILCTNNENNICMEKTYIRMLNVIKGYVTDKGKAFDGLSGNMKYYRTAMIPREIEEDTTVGDTLINYIKEMVQLEHGINIDSSEYHIILTDEDADKTEEEWYNHKNCKAFYMSRNVLLTASQRKQFSTIDIKTIPDYYFENELREAGEIW